MSLLSGLVPGLGLVKGMALTLRRFFAPKATVMYPEMPADVATKFRGFDEIPFPGWPARKVPRSERVTWDSAAMCTMQSGAGDRGRSPRNTCMTRSRSRTSPQTN